MDPMEAENLLKKIDRRLQSVEQILPTQPTRVEMQEAVAPLASKDELRAAVARLATKDELEAAVARLATKEELRAAVAPLATKEDLRAFPTRQEVDKMIATAVAPLATRAEMLEEGERTRRHFDIVAEGLRDDIGLIAESQAAMRADIARGRKELDAIVKNHEKRITRLEASDARRRKAGK